MIEENELTEIVKIIECNKKYLGRNTRTSTNMKRNNNTVVLHSMSIFFSALFEHLQGFRSKVEHYFLKKISYSRK